MPIKLTLTSLKTLDSDDPRGTDYQDSILRGFGVRVYPDGRKDFWVRYGSRNRRRRMSIGRLGVLTLDQARKKAELILASARLGADPARAQTQQREVPTFKEWAEEYLKAVRLRKKRPDVDELYLGRAIKRWGGTPLDEITSSDLEASMQAEVVSVRARLMRREKTRAKSERRRQAPIPETAGMTTANRFFASVQACFQAAWRAGHISENPAMRVKGKYRENPPRSRVLSTDEMRRLLEVLDSEANPHVRAAFRLLVETGARRSEVLRATWDDIDLDEGLWRIPSPKSGRPQVIPLPNRTIAMLGNLPRYGKFVIAGRYPDRPRADLKKAWNRIRQQAELKDVTIHDIRRTFGLHAARTAGLHIASKLLRHSDIRITEGVYAPLGIDDLREAMERVQNHPSVVEFRR